MKRQRETIGQRITNYKVICNNEKIKHSNEKVKSNNEKAKSNYKANSKHEKP